jgi:AraC-like DNA-binding protein
VISVLGVHPDRVGIPGRAQPSRPAVEREDCMSFLWHAVAPPLNAYIRSIYLAEGPMPSRQDGVFPMPWTDLKFNLGDPWRVDETLEGSAVSVCDQSWCVGIWNRRHVVEWPAQTQFLGVTFKPGGAYAFLDIPLSELHNRVVPLDAIWGRFAAEARERLHAATTPERRFALVEEILLARMQERQSELRVVDHVTKQIADRRGSVQIGELTDEIGVSRKHLITLFKRMVGCTPKELARLHRFRRTLLGIDVAGRFDWTSLAHENDYYDQSHFIRDFEAYTGLSPTAYLKLRRRVHAEAPQHAAILQVLPTG